MDVGVWYGVLAVAWILGMSVLNLRGGLGILGMSMMTSGYKSTYLGKYGALVVFISTLAILGTSTP